MAALVDVAEKDFDREVLQPSKPAVVYFHADWSSVCKRIHPYVELLAQQKYGVMFARIDADSSDSLAAKYGVTTVPAFLFLKNGAVVDSLAGANESALRNKVDQLAA